MQRDKLDFLNNGGQNLADIYIYIYISYVN